MALPSIRNQFSDLDYRDFGGTYNTRDSDINVADNDLTGGRNVDISPDKAVKKRKGHTAYGNFVGAVTGVLGLVSHEPPAGTAELLMTYDTNIYRYVAGTWTALTGGATLTTNLPSDAAFFPLTSKTYITNGTDNVQVYTSGSSIASDSSFKKGKYIIHYKNRLLTSIANQLWYTDLGVDTFSSNNYLKAEGDITGLEVLYDKWLTFTKRKVYVTQNFSFSGVAAGPESFLPLRTDFGAVYDRTIAKVNNLVFFLGQDSEGLCAVYVTDGFTVTVISDVISPDMNSLAAAQLTSACASAWGRFYRLSVPASGQTTNTLEYLYDTVAQRWLPPYENNLGGFSCYASAETSGQLYLYAGSQSRGQVYRLNQVDYDEIPAEHYLTIGAADTAVDANPAKRAAQSFELSDYGSDTSVTVNSLWLRLKKNAGTTTDLTVRIETDNNGVPSGSLADAQASATIAAFSATSYAYKQATFTGVTLSGSTTYWIVVKHATEGSGDSQYYWSGNASSPTYAEGNLATYEGGALGSTDTFTPDSNPESATVDGVVFRSVSGSPESFSTIRGAATGSFGDSTNTMIPNLLASTTADTYDEMARGIVLFDTSPLPADAVISAATLSVYSQFTVNGLSQSLGVTSSNPASNTGLEASDYAVGDFGSTRFASDVSIGSIVNNAYNDIALNASGIAAISLSGVTKFALRLSSDIDNSAPTWSSGAQSAVVLQTAETSNPPRLTVTYTTAGGTAVWTAAAGTDQNFLAAVQGAIDGYADTKAFFLAPQGQKAHMRDLFVTASAEGDYDLEVGLKSSTFSAFSTTTMSLNSGSSLIGVSFTIGEDTLGGASRSEERLRLQGSRTRTCTFRFRNRNANEPFAVYGFRTRHEVLSKIK